MIKIRGEISDIVWLLKDDDQKLIELVKLFLHEMHSKNNDSIFKLISHAINRISEIDNFSEEDFKDIAVILSQYVTKDWQINAMIEILCKKLQNSTRVKEIRNTAYFLSLLNFTEKHLVLLLDYYD